MIKCFGKEIEGGYADSSRYEEGIFIYLIGEGVAQRAEHIQLVSLSKLREKLGSPSHYSDEEGELFFIPIEEAQWAAEERFIKGGASDIDELSWTAFWGEQRLVKLQNQYILAKKSFINDFCFLRSLHIKSMLNL